MPSSSGAFIDALNYVLDKDLEEKRKLVKHIIDHNLPITGEEMMALVFGDYLEFCIKFEGLK